MFQLFETIKTVNGKLFNLEFHNERLNKTRKELFGKTDNIFLEEILRAPSYTVKGLYKCRVVYDEEIRNIEWLEYEPRDIKRLKVVTREDINYQYKYCDRDIFKRLLKENNCGENEEILIIKNGKVTDTSYSNIALYDGQTWFTPKHPLLKGTKREELLQKNILVEKDILEEQLLDYLQIKLINAMLDFKNSPALPIDILTF